MILNLDLPEENRDEERRSREQDHLRMIRLEDNFNEAARLLERINALELDNWPTRNTVDYIDRRDELTAETSAFLKKVRP